MIPDDQTPDFVTDPEDRNTELNNDSNERVDSENLNYDEATNSYEYDVRGDNPDYDHPDPYNTAVKDGEDMNSTYDEANPYDTTGEYDENRSLETDAETLGMHIDSGKIVESATLLWHTPQKTTAMTWTKRVILKTIHPNNNWFILSHTI